MGILSGKYFSPDGGPTDARLNLFKGQLTSFGTRFVLSPRALLPKIKEGKRKEVSWYA